MRPETIKYLEENTGSNSMEYYTATKKVEVKPFATTSMSPEGIMLSEISKTEKEKYQMISLICRI